MRKLKPIASALYRTQRIGLCVTTKKKINRVGQVPKFISSLINPSRIDSERSALSQEHTHTQRESAWPPSRVSSGPDSQLNNCTRHQHHDHHSLCHALTHTHTHTQRRPRLRSGHPHQPPEGPVNDNTGPKQTSTKSTLSYRTLSVTFRSVPSVER